MTYSLKNKRARKAPSFCAGSELAHRTSRALSHALAHPNHQTATLLQRCMARLSPVFPATCKRRTSIALGSVTLSATAKSKRPISIGSVSLGSTDAGLTHVSLADTWTCQFLPHATS